MRTASDHEEVTFLFPICLNFRRLSAEWISVNQRDIRIIGSSFANAEAIKVFLKPLKTANATSGSSGRGLRHAFCVVPWSNASAGTKNLIDDVLDVDCESFEVYCGNNHVGRFDVDSGR